MDIQKLSKKNLKTKFSKDNLLTKLGAYWREALILLLLIFFMFSWQLNISNNKEIEKLKAEKSATTTLNKINENLESIKKNQELYPQINSKISAINNTVKEGRKQREVLEKNKPTKEQSYENFKNADAKKIAEYFINNGYNATIESSTK